MNHKQIYALIACGLLAALLLVACVSNGTPPLPPDPTQISLLAGKVSISNSGARASTAPFLAAPAAAQDVAYILVFPQGDAILPPDRDEKFELAVSPIGEVVMRALQGEIRSAPEEGRRDFTVAEGEQWTLFPGTSEVIVQSLEEAPGIDLDRFVPPDGSQAPDIPTVPPVRPDIRSEEEEEEEEEEIIEEEEPVTPPDAAEIILNNQSGQTICYVRISPTTDTTWGEDWLGSGEIPDGDSYVFSDISPGAYDLLAEDCNNNEVDVQWDVDISGTYIWDVGGRTTSKLLLNNQSGFTICYVRISPTTDDDWGEDWLGSTEVIDPGESRSFEVPTGAYDLRVEDCESEAFSIQRDVDISGTFIWDVVR